MQINNNNSRRKFITSLSASIAASSLLSNGVEKFVNYIMKDGKKSIAEKIVYGAFDIV